MPGPSPRFVKLAPQARVLCSQRALEGLKKEFGGDWDLVEGGETREYPAHLIPEGGFNALPPCTVTAGWCAGTRPCW